MAARIQNQDLFTSNEAVRNSNKATDSVFLLVNEPNYQISWDHQTTQNKIMYTKVFYKVLYKYKYTI